MVVSAVYVAVQTLSLFALFEKQNGHRGSVLVFDVAHTVPVSVSYALLRMYDGDHVRGVRCVFSCAW